MSVEIITDPETKEVIESTPEQKAWARNLFTTTKNRFFKFMFSVWLIKHQKAWLHLGYRSFEEACDKEFSFSRSNGTKYVSVADIALDLLGEPDHVHAVNEIVKNDDYESLEGVSADKLRKVEDFFVAIGFKKSYELICAINKDDLFDLRPIPHGGKPIAKLIEKPIDVEEIKKSEDLKKDFGLDAGIESEPAPKKQKPKPNTAKDFIDHIKRLRADHKSMMERLFDFRINKTLFTECKPELDELYSDLKLSLTEIHTYDRYESDDKEPNIILPDKEFVEVKDIAELCDVSTKAVRKWIDTGKVQQPYIRSRKNGGKYIWKLHPEGLPEVHKNKYYAELARRARHQDDARKELENRERMLILNSLTERARRRALNIELAINRYGHISGEDELGAVLEVHNREHEKEEPLTYKTFKRHLDNYQEEGIKGIVDKRGMHRRGETKVEDVDYEYFRAQFMTQNEKSARQCRKLALGKAKEDGRITIKDGKPYIIDPKTGDPKDSFPVASTFERLVYEREKLPNVVLSRIGEHRFKQTVHYNHVQVQTENMAPGEMYVMDHHTFDVFCRPSDRKALSKAINDLFYKQHKMTDAEFKEKASSIRTMLSSGVSNKEYVRLWLTNCMDYRTNKQLAWWLHEDPPNSDHVKVVFKWACQKWGIPDELLIDNGKDFLAYDFIGKQNINRSDVYDEVKLQGVVGELGVKLTRAKHYQGQAKPIERQYAPIIDNFARQFPTYTGKDPKHLPEQTKENLKKGNIPSALDVIQKFDDFVENTLNRMAQEHSEKLKGKSPNQLWDEERAEREIKAISKQAAQLMTVRATKERQLHGNGFKMSLLAGHYFTAKWMENLSGGKERYYAHWDPADWTQVFIYRYGDNKPMGWAEIKLKTPGRVKSDDDQQKVAQANEQKQQRMKERRNNVRSIQKIAAGMSLQHLQSYVDIENEIYEATVAKTDDQKTQHIRLVHTKLDEIARNRENSFENQLKEKEQLDISKLNPAGNGPAKKSFKNPLDDIDVSDQFEGD